MRLCLSMVAFVFVLAVNPALSEASGTGKSEILSLRDFTKDEVKGVGFTISQPVVFSVKGVGGGGRSFWDDSEQPRNEQGSNLFAGGWIIDATTRNIVWEMTLDNTSGSSDRRTCESELKLTPGSYEVYFAAFGYARHSGVTNFSANIDRRELPRKRNRKDIGEFFKDLFGVGDEMYDDFMDMAKNDWGVWLSTDDASRSAVKTFSAPLGRSNTILTATSLGDAKTVRKTIALSRDVEINVYAIGEGRADDELFDFGWITNEDTRERVWEIQYSKCRYAGGGRKNIRFDGKVRLAKGTYEVVYITDASHSCSDWNTMPPTDPFSYGITLSANNESDAKAVAVGEANDLAKGVIVSLAPMRDDDTKNAGFTLKTATALHVYALGESSGDHHEFADYGWIINTRSGDRVWSMDERKSQHAGGALKNRIVDEIISLPAGDYMAYYQTDDSHSHSEWNDDGPFDPEHWGLTIRGAAKGFDPKTIKTFAEASEEGLIAQIIKVRDDRHERKRFTLNGSTKVRIYAVGEGSDNEMVDYGWIENVKTGETIWEMTYRMTSKAGGAGKNRVTDRSIVLEKGEYELHYQTDDTHSFNDWNDDPPRDPMHWGISVYRTE